MIFRLIFLLLIFCTACRSGEIPCPKVKAVKLRKTPFNWRIQQSSVQAKGNKEETGVKSRDRSTRNRKPSDNRVVTDISVEDWDCPKPGSKKYMPKAVKENIKKNMKKIKDPENNKNTTDPEVIVPSPTN